MTGVPILTRTPISNARLAVEIAWGADLTDLTGASWTWSDVTTAVLQDNGRTVQISVGRDEGQGYAQPAQCTFALLNTSGAYTAFNPLAANWPNVVRNTPVRVRLSLDGGSTWGTRFQGYAVGFVPGWDQSTRKAIVTVTAAGVGRRLGQGNSPLKSAIYRSMIGASPAVYFPLEDGTSATSAASAVATQNPFYVGSTGSFSTDAPDGGGGSLSLGNGTAAMSYPVVGSINTTGVGASFGLAFWVKGTTSGAGWFAAVVTLETDSADTYGWMVYITDPSGGTNVDLGPVKIDGTNSFFVEVTDVGTNVLDGNWHLIWMTVTQDTATQVTISGCVDGQGGNFGSTSTYTIGHITGIRLGSNRYTTASNISSLSVSNLLVWNGTPAALSFGQSTAYKAGIGWAGETPQARISRLCSEEGIPYATAGFYDTSQAMGPQRVDTLTNLLREAETTDRGFLYDGLSGGWQYQGISQRYDQSIGMTLDVPSKHLYDLVPVDDDQRNRNLVKVTRVNGSFAVAEDSTGPLGTAKVGTYDSQITVNTVDDLQLYNRAAWEVWAGTIAGFRYPTLRFNLMRSAAVAAAWLSRADGYSGPVVPGCRIDVTSASTVVSQLAAETISLVLEGYSEAISATMWTVTANCSNNRQYTVQKVGDVDVGRVGADTSSLASSASAGAASLSVATSSLWTTTGTFPLYVEIDGIRVKVTAVTGSSSPQTFTVDSTTVTKALSSGKSVKVWRNGVIKF